MNAKELRKQFIDFFVSKNHTEIKSASLIPDETDPTVLFTTAGMHPLVPFLIGKIHPKGKRLVDYQKCIRTGDIDEVGDAWHLTFFEMLGNWSLNDFWKKEAIEWSFEFMIKNLKIPTEKLAVTVFVGDEDAPFDQESFKIWKGLGISEEKIYKYSKKENWWGPAGKTGPCGPDSEMFFITDKEPCSVNCQPSCGCGKYVEIWNDVFMEFYKNEKGEYEKAERRNVDTGMGLERVVAILNGFLDIYQCDHIKPVLNKIEDLSGKKYDDSADVKKAMRVITDHSRTATFILGDQKAVAPSNLDQGYVLRRLIRRAIRYAKQLGVEKNFMKEIAKIVVNEMKEAYPELEENQEFIYAELEKEENKFILILKNSENKKNKRVEIIKRLIIGKKTKGEREDKKWIKYDSKLLSSKERILKEYENWDLENNDKNLNRFFISSNYAAGAVFTLTTEQGYPSELFFEEINEDFFIGTDINFDEWIKEVKEIYSREFQKHQELSRTAAEGKFKGGLADSGEATAKLHTATHLLQYALRKVLGDHIYQKGSNITADRLRFDFSHPEKMTDQQKQEVEKIVNDLIKQDLPVINIEMSYDQAKTKGAIGLFEDKYGDKVSVYFIGDVENPISMEICGGPHAARTGELGGFKIKKEESSSAGVRRIKAVLG